MQTLSTYFQSGWKNWPGVLGRSLPFYHNSNVIGLMWEYYIIDKRCFVENVVLAETHNAFVNP